MLVHYLTWDDPAQAGATSRAIESAGTVVVPTIVLCEAVWVLRRTYRLGAAEIVAALRGPVDCRGVEVDTLAAAAGLAMLETGGDFADGVILHEVGRARCARLVTFDRGMTALAGCPAAGPPEGEPGRRFREFAGRRARAVRLCTGATLPIPRTLPSVATLSVGPAEPLRTGDDRTSPRAFSLRAPARAVVAGPRLNALKA